MSSTRARNKLTDREGKSTCVANSLRYMDLPLKGSTNEPILSTAMLVVSDS